MKILHIDETFHPLYGYQVNPLAKHQQKMGNDVTIITVDKDHLFPVYKEFGQDIGDVEIHDKIYENNYGVRIIRTPIYGYISYRAIYKNLIFKIIDEQNPDVIFVHLVESYIAIRILLRKNKYPIVFDSHMLSMAIRNPLSHIYEFFYHMLIIPIIKKNNYTVIRTQEDNYVTSHLGIPQNQAPFISFGTDTSLFYPNDEVRKSFRKENKIENDDFVVIYTGKLIESKGAKLLALSFQKKLNICKNIVLIVVGNTVGQYGAEVDEIFSYSENRVIRFPTQKYTELAKFYQSADLSIFPKQCSLSFYDAQACGLPVLSENNNVNVDRCSHGNGINFKIGNLDDLRIQIEKLASMNLSDYKRMSDNALTFIKDSYDYFKISREYTNVLEKEFRKFNNQKK